MATLDFNAHDVEPTAPFDPIPAGKYLAMIIKSEMKPTASGSGSYLELTFQILDGQYKDRQVWARLNLHNQTAQAVSIAKAELSAICRAIGVMQPKDSVELHNLPLIINVKCKKREDNGEISNEVKGYESKSAQPAKPASPMTSNAQAPWKR